MSIYHSEEFNQIAAAQRERQRVQDLEDYNNELRGANVGRIRRFLSAEAFEENKAAANGKNGSSSKLSTLEFLLLHDPEYARIHRAAVEENRTAQAKVTDLEDRIDRAMAKLDKRIVETLDQAITLPDGRKAFMNGDGYVYTADGSAVDPAIVEGYDWQDRPSLEAYLSLTADRSRLDELRDESDRYGLRLGEILEAFEDEDDPPTKKQVQSLREEQDDISDRIKEMDNEVSSVENSFENPIELSQSSPSASPLPIPKADDLSF